MSAAEVSVTRPAVVSKVVPIGSCWGAVSSTKAVCPGSLKRTFPALTAALTVLPATGGGSGAGPWSVTAPAPGIAAMVQTATGTPIHGLRERRTTRLSSVPDRWSRPAR